MSKEMLLGGKIVNTHSLKGEVRIYPYCDGAEFLCDIKKMYIDGESYTVASARVHKGQALVRFKGIDHINKAEPLIGKQVYFKKQEVPLDEGQYYIDDIIGLPVIDIDNGAEYGKVISVFPTGANDVFEIKGESGTYYVPKIDDVIKEINLKEQKILIRPLEGLFE